MLINFRDFTVGEKSDPIYIDNDEVTQSKSCNESLYKARQKIRILQRNSYALQQKTDLSVMVMQRLQVARKNAFQKITRQTTETNRSLHQQIVLYINRALWLRLLTSLSLCKTCTSITISTPQRRYWTDSTHLNLIGLIYSTTDPVPFSSTTMFLIWHAQQKVFAAKCIHLQSSGGRTFQTAKCIVKFDFI